MAVVSVITTIEERFGIAVGDDEISAQTFAHVRIAAALRRREARQDVTCPARRPPGRSSCASPTGHRRARRRALLLLPRAGLEAGRPPRGCGPRGARVRRRNEQDARRRRRRRAGAGAQPASRSCRSTSPAAATAPATSPTRRWAAVARRPRRGLALARRALPGRALAVGHAARRVARRPVRERVRRRPADGLLLWQPVVNGAQHLGQFLRLKTVGALLRERRARRTRRSTPVARSRSRRRAPTSRRVSTIEVAGYRLTPLLADAIEAARLGARPRRPLTRTRALARGRRRSLRRRSRRSRPAWSSAGATPAATSRSARRAARVLADAGDRALRRAGRRHRRRARRTGRGLVGGRVTGVPGQAAGARPTRIARMRSCSRPATRASSASSRAPQPGPDDAVPCARLGVLIVVGGPQYRVGSHRQFVLLARALAARGFAAMRFDCTGMGDSDGARARRSPTATATSRAAIDAFIAHVPTVDESRSGACATRRRPRCCTRRATRACVTSCCSTRGCAATRASRARTSSTTTRSRLADRVVLARPACAGGSACCER